MIPSSFSRQNLPSLCTPKLGGNVFFLILVIRNMRFTGAFEVGMARARWELVCNRPAEVILNLCAPLRSAQQ
jgi:hypothetical protein